MAVEVGGYTFQGWYNFVTTLSTRSGIYAIGCEKDEKVKVIDVGEAGDIQDRVENHDRKDCWNDECDGKLKYAQYLTPGKTKPEREKIEKEIRDKVNPPCGNE